ncbi:hypothetical protein FHG87_015382 [Trinorchestia longiramus]|nr:hypothetical protein FHG87_015382 [Trinorchestia longiramus]
MDASESDSSVFSTPAPVKKRRGRPKTPCNSSGSRLQAPSEPNSSVRRSARCTHSASTLTGEASDGDEFSSESYEPPRRGGRRGAASTRRTTRSKKLPPRLVNPHLESNEENRISIADKYESVSEIMEAVKVMPKTSSRGRRRRQLYEEEEEKPLYCSPQLVS